MTSLPQESSKRLLSTHGKKSKSTLSAVIPKRLTLYRAIHSYTNARTGKSKTLADAGITFWESELLHDGYRITDQTGTRASRPYTTKNWVRCSDTEKSSANRIAQYEMGYRSPKANRLKEIAKAMNIREEIFLMPDETPIDLLRILIWYDWEHEGVLQLATSRTANTPPGKTVSPIIYSEQLPLNRLLLDWVDKKHSLSVRKITRADYLEWMLQWPPRLP